MCGMTCGLAKGLHCTRNKNSMLFFAVLHRGHDCRAAVQSRSSRTERRGQHVVLPVAVRPWTRWHKTGCSFKCDYQTAYSTPSLLVSTFSRVWKCRYIQPIIGIFFIVVKKNIHEVAISKLANDFACVKAMGTEHKHTVPQFFVAQC